MLFQQILVPLDGTELAEKTLPYAKSIAKSKKSNIILFAVSLPIFVDRRDRLFSSYLEVHAQQLNEEGIKATTVTTYGQVADEIIKYANSNKIDLIVMATRGYSRAKKWMFGSITQKVLYGTTIPVLLLKAKSSEVSAEFNRILVPVDGSPFSESTFPYIEELARNTGREILLLHICEPPLVPSYGSRPINPTWQKYRDEMWAEMENHATSYLKKTAAALTKKKIQVKTRVVKAHTGEVPRIIMQTSKEENIALLVIATQGRTGIRGVVYGSVANRIAEESVQPVLLIRPATTTPLSPPQTILDDIWHGYLSSKT